MDKRAASGDIRMKTWKKYRVYIVAFIIPFVAMLGICIARGIYPFGKNSFMHCDMYHQYVPFLTELRRKLQAGETLSYAWHVGLGSDFTSIYAYYLATPSNWLVYFCPENLTIEFMTFMILVKIALCGPAFAFYLRRRFRSDSLLVLGFSTMYAMSGFVAAYNWNHMWLDVVWLAPLVLLGLERLVKERKCGMYGAALAASIYTNYYLSIMLCIFLVLYFVLLLFTSGLKVRDKGAAVVRFALYSLLAGGMAALLLIPALSAMGNTGFLEFGFPRELKFYFNGLEVIARHFLTVPKEIGLDHWPNIYCGAAVFLLFPMYLMCGGIPLRQRIGKCLLAAFLMLGFSTNMLNFIWHGMNYPDSLPARQSFLYIFLLLTMGFEALISVKRWKTGWFAAAFLTGSGVLALCGIFVTTDGFTVTVAALTWCFFIVYAILALCYLLWAKGRKAVVWAATVVLVGECVLNMGETSVPVVRRAYYTEKWHNYEELAKLAREESGENALYRFESFCAMTKNDSVLAGYPGVSVFSSTTNSRVRELYENIGLEGTKVSYYTGGLTPLTGAMLGIKYTFSQREEDPGLYRQAGQSGDMYLYENRYTLPVGYVLDRERLEKLEEIIAGSGENGLKTQNDMGKALGAEDVIFRYAGTGDCIEVKKTAHYYAYIQGNPGKRVIMSPVIEPAVTAEENAGEEVSAGAEENATAEVSAGAEASAAAEETREYKDLKKNCIIDLGLLEEGSAWIFTLPEEQSQPEEQSGQGEQASQEQPKKPRLTFYELEEAMLSKALETLGGQPFSVQEYRDGYLTGTTHNGEAGDLLLSVPAEKGWTVRVDGKEIRPEVWAEAFIRIPVEAGEHEVELRYRPAGLGTGAAISAFCLCIFLGLQYRAVRREKTVRKRNCNE